MSRRALLLSGGALVACSGGSPLGNRPSEPRARGPAAPAGRAPPAERAPPEPGPTAGRDRLKRTDESFHGADRSWFSYPPTRPAADRAPLVMCIHGHGQSPADMFEKNHWGRSLETAGWFGLFPQTDQGSEEDAEGGDLEFLTHVLQWGLSAFPVDPARVYCLGFSGGGLKTYKLAATQSGLLAAIAAGSAPVAHTNEPQFFPATTHPKPLSIFHCHGLRDTTVPFAGGDTSQGHPVYAARDGLDLWARALGAEKQASTDLPPGVPARCTAEWWKAASGHEIHLVVDPRLDHRWPGADEGDWYNKVILDFFDRMPRRG